MEVGRGRDNADEGKIMADLQPGVGCFKETTHQLVNECACAVGSRHGHPAGSAL